MPTVPKRLVDWTYEDLQALVEDPPAVEGQRLEFKLDHRLFSSDKAEKDKARLDVLKDIAAMANTAGGIILLGIRQTPQQGSPPYAAEVVGIDDCEKTKQAICALADKHLDVRPARLEMVPIDCPNGRSVLAILVPQNSYALSMVTLDSCNQFWVRRGYDNRLMSSSEIAYRFDEYARVRDSSLRTLQVLKEQFQRGQPVSPPLVWCSAVPLGRGADHIPVNCKDLSTVLRESRYYDGARKDRQTAGWPSQPYSLGDDMHPCLEGMRALTESALLEVCRDGAVSFATKIVAYEDKAVHLICLYEPILSFLHALKHVQEHYGCPRQCLTQAGLVGVAGMGVSNNPGVSSLSEDLSPFLPSFREGFCPLDALFLDDEWEPKKVFEQWARQLANALGQEKAMALKGFITQEGQAEG